MLYCNVKSLYNRNHKTFLYQLSLGFKECCVKGVENGERDGLLFQEAFFVRSLSSKGEGLMVDELSFLDQGACGRFSSSCLAYEGGTVTNRV